jgi:succinate dehydrogenase / fumarate reductase membrane anchor subunit
MMTITHRQPDGARYADRLCNPTMLIWNVGIWMRGRVVKKTRSPLSRIRGLGSAKAGTRDFWIRRLTAAAYVPLALLLIASIIALTGANYATVRSYLGNPLVAIPTLLLVLSGTRHMRIGMQVVLEDYIHKKAPKVISLASNNLFSPSSRSPASTQC